MRLTKILCKQHMGRFIRSHWYRQRNRTIIEDGAEKFLKARGIKIVDPKEFMYTKTPFERITLPLPLRGVEEKNDETHINWHDSPCFMYEDNDLLIEGVTQAKVLAKTILFEDEFPKRIENLFNQCPENVHNLVLRSILNSNLFDAYQQVLPKLKDPERPAWNFPRSLGITSYRKSFNLLHKLLQLCESINGAEIGYQRSVIDNGIVALSIEKDLDLIQFSLNMDLMMTSILPLKPFLENNIDEELPNLHPLHHTISLRKTNIYEEKNFYPIDFNHSKPHVHTILIHHDPVVVKNLTEFPVEETQILARNMLKAFTAAASCAQKRFGDKIKDLPEPISIQCIETDGENFHFSTYQLNTLNLNGTEGLKNYWWSSKRIKLFDEIDYTNGTSQLEGYNPEVFKRMYAFYINS
ncbi:39S ribosomal protein L37, mitochondrial [Leptopilina boulardi]|uniref:39S ribosomal protein L37, mitochondrial n=1 Tax=Leptopilina boulardi TaxID=63433 RepID=UPI0021F5BC9C|nr:39S ribosomal protein L37, mitochondrial [Leptopilina boulardi]